MLSLGGMAGAIVTSPFDVVKVNENGLSMKYSAHPDLFIDTFTIRSIQAQRQAATFCAITRRCKTSGR